jgi:hypothetical protein
MIVAVTAALALLVPAQAASPEPDAPWRVVGMGPAGAFGADVRSIRHEGDTAWITGLLARTEPGPDNAWAIVQLRFDCGRVKGTVLQMDDYAADGRLAEANTVNVPVEADQSESMLENLYEAACYDRWDHDWAEKTPAEFLEWFQREAVRSGFLESLAEPRAPRDRHAAPSN